MADPVYGLTSSAARQTGQVVRQVLRTLPPTGRRTRRVIGGGGGGGGGGTSDGSTGCCCNSMNCVRLCDLTVTDVITDCGQCLTGATKTYTVAFATGYGWLAVTATLTHVDGGCTWESLEFDITISGITGSYKWVFVQDGASSTITLTWVSGDDPVQTCADYATPVVIAYEATTTQGQAWSCLCNSKMQLTTDRTTIPADSGMFGEICVVPQQVPLPGSGGCVCWCDETITWSVTLLDVVNTAFAGLHNIPAGTYTLTYADSVCLWRYTFSDGGINDYILTISALSGDWVATLFACDVDTGSEHLVATYFLAGPIACDGEAKTLSLTSQDSPDTTGLASSLTYTPSGMDCMHTDADCDCPNRGGPTDPCESGCGGPVDVVASETTPGNYSFAAVGEGCCPGCQLDYAGVTAEAWFLANGSAPYTVSCIPL